MKGRRIPTEWMPFEWRPWMGRALALLGGGAILVASVVWLSGGFGPRIAPRELPPAGPELGAAQRAAGPGRAESSGKVATVERVSEPLSEWESGTVASARRTAIASRVMARIDQIPVRAGSEVKEGDVVVVLDSRDLEARVKEAEQQLEASRARLSLARTDKNRMQQLFNQGVTPRARLDQAVSALRVARADVDRLDQNLAAARTNLSYATIHSQVSGRVVDRLAEPGDTAVPGKPLLRIYDPSVLRVEAPVRESLAIELRIGQPLRVQVPALDGKEFHGTVDEIVPFADPGARTLLVKVRLPASPDLYAGMYAQVEVPAGEQARLLVPKDAVERIGQLEYATVVLPDGRLERRMVTTGRTDDSGRIEVLSGLAEGENVRLPPPSAD